MKFLTTLSIGLLFSGVAIADTELDINKLEYQHQGDKYPPVLFVTNIEDQELKSTFESFQAFEKLDKDSIGLPIGIRVLKAVRTKRDGANLSSGLLAATTLGIIPVVSNTEFKVVYQVFLQGKEISNYEYIIESTEVGSMWSNGGVADGRDSKPSEQLFIEKTVPHFLNDLIEDDEAQATFAEYREYFGES
ncbi:hypothetical protein [Ferrimonas aestuarii]|uniref:Uncharacterized protein n=1 Tax=Ferrimonas aestuarii TaxID=2569539 RepID=A0A4U1BPT6_9GAMM|nr:hypothetical protein [Ferrimonas aestuarii]TKB56134.1 hypothetical protein FCL42_07925 [Ferrimonas aestuarii]